MASCSSHAITSLYHRGSVGSAWSLTILDIRSVWVFVPIWLKTIDNLECSRAGETDGVRADETDKGGTHWGYLVDGKGISRSKIRSSFLNFGNSKSNKLKSPCTAWPVIRGKRQWSVEWFVVSADSLWIDDPATWKCRFWSYCRILIIHFWYPLASTAPWILLISSPVTTGILWGSFSVCALILVSVI